jgi:DNA-binding FadR family transcriptional regulator
VPPSGARAVNRTESDASPDPRRTERPKLAEVIAAEIEQDIVGRGWSVGELVGSEAQLLQKYGVSRAVLREAVRIVEHHYVATMRRGPRGGLLVTAPDIGAIVRAVTLQLQFQHIEPDQLYEARIALELSCARQAAEKLTPDGVDRLKAYLAEERRVGPAEIRTRSHDVHILIADLTGNPALRLFVEVLGRLTMQQSGYPSSQAEIDAVTRSHVRIVDALIAHDADAAERRMQRHLLALTKWLRSNPAGIEQTGRSL